MLFHRLFLGQGLLRMPISSGLENRVLSESSARCHSGEGYTVVSGVRGIAATDRSLKQIYRVPEETRRTHIEIQKLSIRDESELLKPFLNYGFCHTKSVSALFHGML